MIDRQVWQNLVRSLWLKKVCSAAAADIKTEQRMMCIS
jgi:hypothetical protein